MLTKPRDANVLPLPQSVGSAPDSVGSRIRLLRRHRKMTQKELADKLHVSRSAVALWETNRGGEVQHIEDLGRALGVSADYFITGMGRRDEVMTLAIDETHLISLYRRCDPAGQLELLRQADRLMERAGHKALAS
jgi:transcriptional regulator with XRE-family HTH domain